MKTILINNYNQFINDNIDNFRGKETGVEDNYNQLNINYNQFIF